MLGHVSQFFCESKTKKNVSSLGILPSTHQVRKEGRVVSRSTQRSPLKVGTHVNAFIILRALFEGGNASLTSMYMHDTTSTFQMHLQRFQLFIRDAC